MRDAVIVRKIDSMGRFVVPMEIRRKYACKGFGIKMVPEGILLMPHYNEHTCSICNENDSACIIFKGRLICEHCIEGLKGMN